MPNLKSVMSSIVSMTVGITATILIVLAMSTTASRPALATAAIAKSTGQACSKCHTAAPTLNSYGKKYKASHKK